MGKREGERGGEGDVREMENENANELRYDTRRSSVKITLVSVSVVVTL